MTETSEVTSRSKSEIQEVKRRDGEESVNSEDPRDKDASKIIFDIRNPRLWSLMSCLLKNLTTCFPNVKIRNMQVRKKLYSSKLSRLLNQKLKKKEKKEKKMNSRFQGRLSCWQLSGLDAWRIVNKHLLMRDSFGIHLEMPLLMN